jgi:hypothetical protein
VTPDPMRPGGRARGAARRLGARLALVVAAGALSIGALLWSCSGNDGAAPLGDTVNPVASAVVVPDCTVPNAGCACTQPGEIQKCGKVVYKSESYVSCSIGLRTCQSNGTWTDCQGAQVVTLNGWQAEGLRLLSQPQPAAVSANSVCDPNLFEIPSILGTQDAAIDDGGITVVDGGITLTHTGTGGVVVGCSDAAVAVTPGDASLQLTQLSTPPSPNSLQLQASLSGCAGDGSVNALWTVDQPGIAIVNEGGTLSLAYPYAGPIHVTAYVGSLSGTATVNVSVNLVDTSALVDAGADANGIAKAFLTTCGVDAGGGG